MTSKHPERRSTPSKDALFSRKRMVRHFGNTPKRRRAHHACHHCEEPKYETVSTRMSSLLQNAVAAWNNDRTSNTVELVSQAAGLLMQFCDGRNAGDDERFKTELAAFCLSLIKMRPGTAALWNLANDALNAAEHPLPIPGPNGPRPLTPVQAASNAALRFLAFL